MNATTTDGEAILRAIIADPSDDLVRLAYADWLEETGDDARAEFIRMQIEMWRRNQPEPVACSVLGGDSIVLAVRERGLWLAHGAAFLRGLPGAAESPALLPPTTASCGLGSHHWEYEFRRGFVEAVRCPLAAWKEHGESILASHPVTRVELSDREPIKVASASDSAGAYEWRLDDGGWAHDPTEDRALLPAAIFTRVMDVAEWRGVSSCRFFAAREPAISALSDALIRMAFGAYALAWAKHPDRLESAAD